MSISNTVAPEADSPPTAESGEHPKTPTGKAIAALALRVHFYAGIFVAPFILIAAVTGAFYAISPTLESILDRNLLHAEATGPAKPLSDQVTAAVAIEPNLALAAVAPAPEPGDTTRVIFTDPSLGESERRAVFVDPTTARPVGAAMVYGSSGALPMRTWIDRLHRDLHLGEPGRVYSELAASWLSVIALAGLVLWVRRVRSRRNRNSARWLLAPDRSGSARGTRLNWHGAVGMWVLPVILLLSATGLTWSTCAGENITELREQFSWTTPAISTALPGSAATAAGSGDDHHVGLENMPPPAGSSDRIAQIDRVYEVARTAGVTRPVEIAIPVEPDTAFGVKERRMPGTYTVDAVAVDGATGTIADRLPYAEWPLLTKLTNWGIQFHMGLMFGLLNQLLLLAAMIGLSTTIVLGYRMWWQRRPTRGGSRFAVARAPRRGALRAAPRWIALPTVAAALLVGWFVPLVGMSLLAFLAIDGLLGLVGRRRTAG